MKGEVWFEGPGGDTLPALLERIEQAHLRRALRETAGAKKKAAKLLGISFRQFRYLVAKYEISYLRGN